MVCRISALCALLLCVLPAVTRLEAQIEASYPLRKLLLSDSERQLAALSNEAGATAPVFVQNLPVFSDPNFAEVVRPFLGKPIDSILLNALGEAIVGYAKAHDRLIAKVNIPVPQDISTGVLRLVVLIGTYNELSFQGNRWFSQNLLEERLGIKPGDEIRLSTLEEAVNWLNSNPFRYVKVLLNETPNQLGKGNLLVAVQEARPFRAALSIDNTGNEVIGKQRFAAAFNFGNLWGRDHQASYQYLTTSKPEFYQGHAIDYRIPLPTRHFFQVSANYVQTDPVFNLGLLAQEGRSIVANTRYVVPLRGGPEPREFSFGVSFKRSNNNLDFVGLEESIRVDSDSTDTFQMFGGFSAVKRDRRGAWMLGASLYLSPGNIDSRNTDEALQGARPGAKSSYIYGNIALQRTLRLGYGWEFSIRGLFQRSTDNLLAGEQLSIGGSGSVRGYDENIYSGENGFVLNNELQAPAISKKLSFLPKYGFPLESRFMAFLDIAKVEYENRFASDIILAALGSTGVGLRSSLGNNFSLSFDYGWQLMHMAQNGLPRPPPLSSRGHLKVVLAF